jgi:hypothetical protein
LGIGRTGNEKENEEDRDHTEEDKDHDDQDHGRPTPIPLRSSLFDVFLLLWSPPPLVSSSCGLVWLCGWR